MYGRRCVHSGRGSTSGAQPTQLHQGGRRLRVSRTDELLLPDDTGVPPPVRHTQQSRGQATDKEHHLPHREGCLGRVEKQRTAVSVKSMLRQRTPPIEAGQFHCAVESSAADVRPSRDVSGSKYNVRASYKRVAMKKRSLLQTCVSCDEAVVDTLHQRVDVVVKNEPRVTNGIID